MNIERLGRYAFTARVKSNISVPRLIVYRAPYAKHAARFRFLRWIPGTLVGHTYELKFFRGRR